VLARNNYGVDYKPFMGWYAFQVADITHALQQPAGKKVPTTCKSSDVKLDAIHLGAYRTPCCSNLDHLYI
jgi:hypothetical protein